MHKVFNKFDNGEWQFILYQGKDSSYDPPILLLVDNAADEFTWAPKGINWFYKYGFNEFSWLGFDFSICLKNPLRNLVRNFIYKNYKGEIGPRKVVPFFKYFGKSKYHRKLTWLLLAWDLDKKAWRTFDTKEIFKK